MKMRLKSWIPQGWLLDEYDVAEATQIMIYIIMAVGAGAVYFIVFYRPGEKATFAEEVGVEALQHFAAPYLGLVLKFGAVIVGFLFLGKIVADKASSLSYNRMVRNSESYRKAPLWLMPLSWIVTIAFGGYTILSVLLTIGMAVGAITDPPKDAGVAGIIVAICIMTYWCRLLISHLVVASALRREIKMLNSERGS